VPQVSTLAYFVPKTSETFWGNQLQGSIGNPCPRCRPPPLFYQKQAKLLGEIISRDQLTPRAPGFNHDLFNTKNKRNFLWKSSLGTNRHSMPQLSTLTFLYQKQPNLPGRIISRDQPALRALAVIPNCFLPKTSENSWGNHLRGPIDPTCPRCRP